MASSSKRQQTMAKRNREQAVREKRELKLAKKHAAAIARNAPPEEVELFGPLGSNERRHRFVGTTGRHRFAGRTGRNRFAGDNAG